MSERLVDSPWTDEVCRAWVLVADERFVAFREAGGNLVDAVTMLRNSIPLPVIEFLDRDLEARSLRLKEIIEEY
jgi:hypothetical protein